MLFEIFLHYNISIKPTKSFLNYPDVRLLGQRVNSLRLTTSDEKLKAIRFLAYSDTLGALEYYLGLTGYLQNYIHFYAQLAAPLQELKTSLLRHAPVASQQRRAYASKTKLGPPTPQKLASFQSIQEALSQPATLVHHDLEKILWIDLDMSKEFGFGAIVFHTAANETLLEGRWPSTTLVQPVLFLSRLLTLAKKNYWPTELEIAGFVWVIKKVRHIIESSKAKVIIQTDHLLIIDILQQSSITSTTSTMRLNLRLVQASQFLQQFRLDVGHKPEKEHIIPNALSHLANATPTPTDPYYSELDALYIYNTTLIEIHPHLISRILAGYDSDLWWARLHQQIRSNHNLGVNAVALPFILGFPPAKDADPYLAPRPESGEPTNLAEDFAALKDPIVDSPAPDKSKLLYHVNKLTGVHRLCVPPSVAPDILAIAHGEGHPGFARCYKIISRSWFVKGLTKLLCSFIRHCPQCLALQTRRHPPYGSLQPIESPPVPFFTPTLDFVLALPVSKEGYNALMSVTCKFSKRITLIEGVDTWTAEQWAQAFLKRLDLIDWGLPAELITDRDPKFLSKFWTALVEKLGVKLLYSTAYHSQTDRSSERTNQTVEIALRFFVHALEDPSLWLEVLPQIQSILNNTSSSTTGKTPNEMAYGFSPRKPLDLLSLPGLPAAFQAGADAANAISFVLANQKAHYDRKHQPLFLKIGDWAMLRLHKGYSIPSSLGVIKKLTQQFVGPFRVLERVDCLAYKLDVPQDWRIYPVFSIAQLEPAPSPAEDSFGRLRPKHPPPVFVEGDTDAVKSFEIDRLLNKRTVKKGRGHAVEYLVRWTGYGPKWNRWYNIKDLDNATKLVCNYEEAISQRRR